MAAPPAGLPHADEHGDEDEPELTSTLATTRTMATASPEARQAGGGLLEPHPRLEEGAEHLTAVEREGGQRLERP